MFTPQQIDQISFNRATFGGYDMQAVDEFLEPLTEDYVTLYKENALLYMFVMPIGSRNITRDITSLKVLEETAEQIKRSIGNAMSNADANKLSIEGISGTEVSNYIMARSGEIVANIIEQLQHAGLTVADIPAGIVVIGGGAKLNGFAELIAQQTNANAVTSAATRTDFFLKKPIFYPPGIFSIL